MFKTLSDRISHILRFNINSKSRLTEENIKDAIQEIYKSFLEADVALPVIEKFINSVKDRALGKEINKSFKPGQEFIKIAFTELVNIIGSNDSNALNLISKPPVTILVIGQPGTGKTTSLVKLGNYLHKKQKKKVIAVSTDIYRPAAIQQLEMLSYKANISFFSSDVQQKPLDIINKAFNYAQLKFYDVLLIDTAGRMPNDKKMMTEIISINNTIQPTEILFIIDAMVGQDAANSAKLFNQALPLTGVIITKMDSDSHCGAALSIRYITGKPIKFIGTGENNDDLELFNPERLAKRILGINDMSSIIYDLEKENDHIQAKNIAYKIIKDGAFCLTDFMDQLKQLRNMGGLNKIINKMSGITQLSKNLKFDQNEKIIMHMEAIINSMTKKERVTPHIIKGSRKQRIAAGSGMRVQDVNQLLKKFDDMQRIMKKMKNNNVSRVLRNIKSMIR